MIMYGAVFSNAVQYSLQRQDERFRPIYLTARELDETKLLFRQPCLNKRLFKASRAADEQLCEGES